MSYTMKKIGKNLPDGGHLQVTIEERDDSGDLSPGFSVTGALWESRGPRSGRERKQSGADPDVAGCIHGEILQHLPHLAPLVHVHLADQSGLPMHAKVNGWYFYSGSASAYERGMIEAGKDYGYSRLLEMSDHDRGARALNIPPVDLPTGLDKERFEAFVDSLTERYAADAATARALLASL